MLSFTFQNSNTCLNSAEHKHYFPQQKIKRTNAWFQVSKRFVMLECSICSLFKDERIYEYIFMNMFQTLLITPNCLLLSLIYSLKIFSFECLLFLISLGK